MNTTTKISNLDLTKIVFLINLIIESSLLLFETRTIIILFQLLVNFIYISIVLHANIKIKRPKYFIPIIIALVLYNISLVVFSSNLVSSFNKSLKFLLPICFLVFGYTLIWNKKRMKEFVSFSWIYLLYFCAYIILANIFGIGNPLYKSGILTGYFSINGLYIPCFVTILLIFNLNLISSKNKRTFSLILIAISTIIFILLLKRTLILLLGIAFAIKIYKYVSIKKFVGYASILILLTLALPKYRNYILDNFKTREARFSNNYSITKEGRFTENIIIYNYLNQNSFRLLLGTGEVFNDREFLSKAYHSEREAHNSYIRLFWNGGIIGLSIFIIFILLQFVVLIKFYKNSKDQQIRDLLLFAIVFIFLRFLNDFSSGITYLTYNAICYFIIGGICRIAESEHLIKLENIQESKKIEDHQ